MSRKAISEETLTYLIIAVVGLIIMAWATTSIADTIKSTTDKEACRASVELKAQTILKIPVGGNVPLKCKSQELKITDKNQEKMKETIANAMYDCWYQYGEGKIDFIKLFSNTAVECYICSKITFDPSLKTKDISNFDKYLINKDYATFLFGENYNQKISDFNNIPIDKNLYVIFVSYKERGIQDQISNIVPIAEHFIYPSVNFLGNLFFDKDITSAKPVYDEGNTFLGYLKITNADDVEKICSGTSLDKYPNKDEYCSGECGKEWTKFCNRDNCKSLSAADCYLQVSTSGGSRCTSCPQNCEDFNKLTPISIGQQYCNDCRNCKFENNKCVQR